MLIRHLLLAAVLVSACSRSRPSRRRRRSRDASPIPRAARWAARRSPSPSRAPPAQPRLRPRRPRPTAPTPSPSRPGTHVLQVEAPGFQSWIQSVVVFDAPQTVDVILPVGGVTETRRRRGAEARRGTAAGDRASRRPRADDHQRADRERRLRRRGAGAAGAGARPVSEPEGRRVRLRQRVAPGLAHQRDPLARRRRAHQQSPVQRHDAARHAAGAHGRTDRGARGRPGPLLRHAGRRRRDQRRHQGVHRGRRAGACSVGFDTNEGTPPQRCSPATREVGTSLRAVRLAATRPTGFSRSPTSEFSAEHDRPRAQLRRADTSAASTPTTSRPALRFSAMYQHSDVRLDSLRPARSSATQVGGLGVAFNDRDRAHLQRASSTTPRERDRAALLQGLLPPVGLVLERGAERRSAPGTLQRHQRPRVLGLQGLRRQRAGQAGAAPRASNTSPATTSRTTRARTTCCSSRRTPKRCTRSSARCARRAI